MNIVQIFYFLVFFDELYVEWRLKKTHFKKMHLSVHLGDIEFFRFET